jgi:hypothetical protein
MLMAEGEELEELQDGKFQIGDFRAEREGAWQAAQGDDWASRAMENFRLEISEPGGSERDRRRQAMTGPVARWKI